MPTEILTLPGATQFTGLAGAGLFVFSTRFSALARSTRIVINSVTYTEVHGGLALSTTFRAQITQPGGVASAYAILGNGLASDGLISPINNSAELKLCGVALFRDPGDQGLFWDLQVFTVDKSQDATVAVDYVICPFPETDPRDSQK